MTTSASATDRAQAEQHPEPHGESLGDRLNWLRAGVLGANDGIVSVAGIVLGVAGATTDSTLLLTAGVAGLSAGAMSMAVGEYVSVSTQRDTERAMLELERRELASEPEEELAELAGIYRAKGLSDELAGEVARALTRRDALAAHAEAELGIDPDELTNPSHAAFASFVSFVSGAILPLIAILLPIGRVRVPLTFVVVLLALALTGWISATMGKAPRGGAIWRNVAGGAIAMAVTYGIGALVGIGV
ncbi:MAG: VIT1/CCC1 transporter family protein [Mycobacteriales bacterium]